MGKTAAEIAQSWQQGMASKGAKYAQGIQNTTVNPMALAAAQADVAVANYAAAKDRMAANLTATPVSFWKSHAAAAQAKSHSGEAKSLPKYTAKIP